MRSTLPRLVARSRLDPNTYHPTLNEAVEAAYARNIELTAFPALVRVKQFEDLEATVKWLKDLSEVRRDPCQPCVDAGRECIPHNGNSIRCLHCFMGDAPMCTHQTRMEDLGHSASPSCMKYSEAVKLDLTPVPADFQWKPKRTQEALKKALRGGPAQGGDAGDTMNEKDDAEEGGQAADVNAEAQDELAEDAEQPSAKAKGKQRAARVAQVEQWAVQVATADATNSGEEQVDELQDDDPPTVETGKVRKPKKDTSRKKTSSGNTAILEDIRMLLQHLVKTNDELLELKRRRYDAASNSSSESASKRPRTDSQELHTVGPRHAAA